MPDRLLVLATGGAGGDLQPLVATALALSERGLRVDWVGDSGVDQALAQVGLSAEVLPPQLDLGPRLVAAVREAQAADDQATAGRIVQERLGAWAGDVAQTLRGVIERKDPDALLTSLFGVEVLSLANPTRPWGVINSTFYIGPGAPRAIEADVAPRALPLLKRYRDLLDRPDLVLHATDPLFDLGSVDLPDRHHYTGPLGIWEPPALVPSYLDEPGEPWVLVTISSQLADDVPLAQAAVAALADQPVRVVVTVGPDHAASELGTLPSNCRVEQFVSHRAVLERGVLLVSHAGHGSVMKALWHGRPMVLVPWGRDQPGVAERAHDLGVAQVVSRESATPDSLAAAIGAVLRDPQIKKRAMDHARRLAPTDPPADAADLVQQMLSAEGCVQRLDTATSHTFDEA